MDRSLFATLPDMGGAAHSALRDDSILAWRLHSSPFMSRCIVRPPLAPSTGRFRRHFACRGFGHRGRIRKHPPLQWDNF